MEERTSAEATLRQFIKAVEEKGGNEAKLLDSTNYVVLAEGDNGMSLLAEHMNPLTFGYMTSKLLIEHLKKEVELDSKIACSTAYAISNMMFDTLDEIIPEDDKFRESLLFGVFNNIPKAMQANDSYFILGGGEEDLKVGMSIHNMSTTQLLAGFFSTIEELANDEADPAAYKKTLAEIIKKACDDILLAE